MVTQEYSNRKSPVSEETGVFSQETSHVTCSSVSGDAGTQEDIFRNYRARKARRTNQVPLMERVGQMIQERCGASPFEKFYVVTVESANSFSVSRPGSRKNQATLLERTGKMLQERRGISPFEGAFAAAASRSANGSFGDGTAPRKKQSTLLERTGKILQERLGVSPFENFYVLTVESANSSSSGSSVPGKKQTATLLERTGKMLQERYGVSPFENFYTITVNEEAKSPFTGSSACRKKQTSTLLERTGQMLLERRGVSPFDGAYVAGGSSVSESMCSPFVGRSACRRSQSASLLESVNAMIQKRRKKNAPTPDAAGLDAELPEIPKIPLSPISSRVTEECADDSIAGTGSAASVLPTGQDACARILPVREEAAADRQRAARNWGKWLREAIAPFGLLSFTLSLKPGGGIQCTGSESYVDQAARICEEHRDVLRAFLSKLLGQIWQSGEKGSAQVEKVASLWGPVRSGICLRSNIGNCPAVC